ncbi:MAG: winged helix-turn-helix domain-containing protein [Chloroflexi bacterium]|nr:winged helix-turn-helix domain-containing protein [Chloroflexota bacterium]
MTIEVHHHHHEDKPELPVAPRNHKDRVLTEIARLSSQISSLYDALVPARDHALAPAVKPDLPASPNVQSLYATCLGSFAIYRADTLVSLGNRRAVQHLFRYLVARTGKVVPREELVELLWPEVEPALANHRLHVTVSALRRLIDEGPALGTIRYESDCYLVPSEALVTDCDLFEHHFGRARRALRARDMPAAAEAFRAALDYYRGDYMADMPYADWVQSQRDHFATRRLIALTFLCDYCSRKSDALGTLDLAQQILGVDELRERAHRELMRAHCVMGQPALALRQYERCARLLRRELGMSPSTLTHRLYEAIVNGTELPAESPVTP